MTGAARLREALKELQRGRETGCAMHLLRSVKRAEAMLAEALAAVPEAPEPEYEWRALYDEDGESCTVSVASERGARLMATDGVHIERRTQAIPAGPWERVEDVDGKQ